MAQEVATKPLATVRTQDLEMRSPKDPEIYAVKGYHLEMELSPGKMRWEENFQTEAERRAFMRGLQAGAMHFGGRIRVVEQDGYVHWRLGSPEKGDPEPETDGTGGMSGTPSESLSEDEEAAERMRRFIEEDRQD